MREIDDHAGHGPGGLGELRRTDTLDGAPSPFQTLRPAESTAPLRSMTRRSGSLRRKVEWSTDLPHSAGTSTHDPVIGLGFLYFVPSGCDKCELFAFRTQGG